MDNNGSVIVLFVLFIVVFGRSDAFSLRRLAAISDPNGGSNADQESLSTSPPPPDKTRDLSPVGAPKPKDKSVMNVSDLESKSVNDTYTKKGSESSSDKKLVTGKNQDGNRSKTFVSESCKGHPVCNDQSKTMMACVQDFENGSNNLTLIVQNEQDVDLKVNITFGTSINNHQTFELPAHATEKVNISLSGDKSNTIILNAGNGDCELQISQPSPVNSVNNPADSPVKPKNVDNPADTPAKPKGVDNPADTPAKPKDVDNPADTPAKPKDVDNPADTPAKPKDVDNPVDTPAKPKDVDNPADTPAMPKDVKNPADTPAKPKDVKNPADTPAKPKDVKNPADTPAKPKDVNTPAKDVNTPPTSKDVDDLSKSKDVDDLSKAKDNGDDSKSKEADNPTKSKSADVDDSSKSTPTSFNAPVSKNNVFDQLTFYSKQVTPIHGAYLAFLVALVIGGSWALCSIRKRRAGGGVPYQELEMGPHESSNAVDVETAEGWDQDWDDDDWDEDKAIRSPGGSSHAKTISSNGLTSRATKKDGWDADWDD